MKKIAIMGGTFDPPHIGHLIVASEVLDKLQLDEVWFIPTNEPPHKVNAETNKEHRLQMIKLATASSPAFKVNEIELNREGKSYTIDTINTLQKKHPSTVFYFIIGGDMVEYLPKWYKINELIKLVKFVGVARKNYTLDSPYPLIKVAVPTIEISSSEIRERIKVGKMTKYFLPEKVFNYIKEYQLYRDKTSRTICSRGFNNEKI